MKEREKLNAIKTPRHERRLVLQSGTWYLVPGACHAPWLTKKGLRTKMEVCSELLQKF